MKYTEIFYSIQGEGKNTGMLCTWLRTFSCTLECKGFGQDFPESKSTWKPQFDSLIDVKELSSMPTPKYGCDSSYSWSKQFRHLALDEKPEVIAKKIIDLTPNKSFNKKIGHVFTGGEPLMHQKALQEVMQCWLTLGDFPAWICFETNGTVALDSEFSDFLKYLKVAYGIKVYFSISPKLLHVAGESEKKAIKLDVIRSYLALCSESYLKFVLNMKQQAWDQAKQIVAELPSDVDVWVMPVGGTDAQQSDKIVSEIADKAIQMQWNVSLRVHVLLWKDQQIGK